MFLYKSLLDNTSHSSYPTLTFTYKNKLFISSVTVSLCISCHLCDWLFSTLLVTLILSCIQPVPLCCSVTTWPIRWLILAAMYHNIRDRWQGSLSLAFLAISLCVWLMACASCRPMLKSRQMFCSLNKQWNYHKMTGYQSTVQSTENIYERCVYFIYNL